MQSFSLVSSTPDNVSVSSVSAASYSPKAKIVGRDGGRVEEHCIKEGVIWIMLDSTNGRSIGQGQGRLYLVTWWQFLRFVFFMFEGEFWLQKIRKRAKSWMYLRAYIWHRNFWGNWAPVWDKVSKHNFFVIGRHKWDDASVASDSFSSVKTRTVHLPPANILGFFAGIKKLKLLLPSLRMKTPHA